MDGIGSDQAQEASTTGATTEPTTARRGAPRIVADYELRERLTRYPAADAFLATHRPSGAPRVMYVLRPAAMQDRGLVHRAAVEVDAARWLRHPAIPALDPCGETAERRLFVAVEHRPGRTLAAVIAEQLRLDVARIVRVATRIVEALDEAHAAGLVHGRISPASIVLGPLDERGGETITLVGLGTAVATAEEITAAERPFTSPEQLAGGEPDARSDVYALAAVLQLVLDLDGRPHHVDEGARTPADVIAVALSADPAARHPGVKAFWEELLGALVQSAGAEAAVASRLTPPDQRPAFELEEELTVVTAPVIAAPVVVAPETAPAVVVTMPRLGWGRRRVTVGLVAAGLLVAAATGLARTVDRGVDAARPTASEPVAGGVSVAGGATQAVAGNAVASSAAPASVPAHDTSTTVAAGALDGPSAEAVRLPSVPRAVVAVEIPDVVVAPAAASRARGDVVRSDEFAAPGALGKEPAAVAAARRDMERALAVFASALESRDAATLRRAAPDMPAERHAFWAGVFRDAQSVRADLSVLDVRLGDDVVVADVRSRVDVQPRGGARPMHSDTVLTATLVRDGSGWRLRTR